MSISDANTICDVAVKCWNCIDKYRKYIVSLGDNLDALERKVDELHRAYDDVKRVVDEAEAQGWIRKRVTDGWLIEVEKNHIEEARKILAEGRKSMERKCLCGVCCLNCYSRYDQSRRTEAKIAPLEAELVRGRAFRLKEDVAHEAADLVLKRSLEALHDKMGELRDVFETVKQRVESEEKRYRVRTPEVGGWMKRVEDLIGKQVQEILEDGELAMKESGQGVEEESQCQRNFRLCHGVAKRADDKRAILEGELVKGRSFTVLTGKPDDPTILERPSDDPVGAESVFKEVWDWVEAETVRCIGLFGMGGVGKTTLLKRVHNQFLKVSHDYNFLLWTVVSRPVNLDKIQEDILKKLKLPKHEWDDLDRIDRAALILSVMKENNFILFLDDLWDSIDLLEDVGIPCRRHSKKCKIVFTTRDKGVCDSMQPDKKKKVKCLPLSEALQLFQQKLGEETWGAHPGIPERAESMVRECKYLPIAIVTVARVMAGKTKLNDWMDAEKDLKSRLSKFPDMEKRALANLEFSYANLPDETHRKCFLYLSIFPEDHEIYEEDAINLWIGEGFLDDYSGDQEARRYGEQIFKTLRSACLVEFVGHDAFTGDFVIMHDVIREMALWVGTEHGLKTNKVLVQEGQESFRSGELRKWKDAERISIWDAESSLHDSLATVSCSHLSTLILKRTSLKRISDEFFLAMPCLRVLDLSDNYDLDDLPSSIWKLINLRYLNLCATVRRVFEVPVEIKNLNKLVVLILSRNFLLPVEVISNTSSIRVFRWSTRVARWAHEVEREIKLLEKLQMMQSIEEIYIELSTLKAVEKLLGCSKLPSCLRRLGVSHCWGMDSLKFSTSLLRRLEHLQSLVLALSGLRQVEITREDEASDECPRRYSYVGSLAPKPSSFACPDSFHSLREVEIFSCSSLIDLTSLIYHTPFLETLCIINCPSLKEVIVGDIEGSDMANSRLFPCLTNLRLYNLERLERICRRALPFPSLKEIKVRRCHKLKELPLNCDNAKALQAIRGEEEWWQGLVWNDPASKEVFSAKFSSED